ncbi:antA/AntB antirepressor family protein, partial [Lactococcus petauri]
MNQLINITQNENNESVVSGRELHDFLEVGTQYTKWFERMVEYGFAENIDFVAISQKRRTAQGNQTEYTDHALKLDMAKEISMIQRTAKG